MSFTGHSFTQTSAFDSHQQERHAERLRITKVDSREQAVALLEGDIISEQGSNTRAKLILSGLDLDVLPHALLAVKHDRLVVLHLQRNKLALLPSELFLRLTELQEIDVSENRLTFIPETIDLPTFLRKLKLKDKQLQDVPKGNRLSYIPETIALLTSLRKLKLKGNQLQEVPDGVCRLHALEELDLSKNALERLPAGIAGLQRLRRLDLSDNNCLQEIPDEAGQLLALDHVDLKGTSVIQMPLAIQRLHTKSELLRSRARRRRLIGRALHVRASVRRAFVEEALTL